LKPVLLTLSEPLGGVLAQTDSRGEQFFENWLEPVLLTLSDPQDRVLTLTDPQGRQFRDPHQFKSYVVQYGQIWYHILRCGVMWFDAVISDIVQNVVSVGVGLDGKLQFCCRCNTAIFITKTKMKTKIITTHFMRMRIFKLKKNENKN